MPTRIDLRDFGKELDTYTELSSVALGGRVISVSDDFFAEAYHLLEVEPAPSLKGQFGPNGALYSGWETKRHNPTYDWCIVKLGATGYLHGFDIDTSHFNGNEAPTASVEACCVEGKIPPGAIDPIWQEVLPKQSLGPDSRHLFKLSSSDRNIAGKYNYVKLNIIPDGGVARFRVYGVVEPENTMDENELMDLAHVFSGGRVVSVSDQHYGKGSNLLLPGRGKDMGDGWETKRSREVGHKDWVLIRLGQPGILDNIEIDTNHFKGNYPESCEIHACNSPHDVPEHPEEGWTRILSRVKLRPHSQQYFTIEAVAKDMVSTHVRITIYPDGGIKRIRIMGWKFGLKGDGSNVEAKESPKKLRHTHSTSLITPEAFSPYGQVLMSWEQETRPSAIKMSIVNQGMALKFHNLALVESSYAAENRANIGFSVYHCSSGPKFGDIWKVAILERHCYTNQAFIPMGESMHQKTENPRAYLVIVALNGKDDKPDLSTLRAFVVPASQGIVYRTGIWHHPMLTIGNDINFTCVETQVGDGSKLDCEIVDITESVELHIVSTSR